MATPLSIDTSAKPVFKTSLTMPQIEALRSQVDLIDPDDSQIEQYQQVNDIINKMKGKFENDYDQMEISQVIGVLDAILNRGKRGSKPYELINVISKVLGRVTDVSTSGARRRTRKKRRTHRQRKVRLM